MGMDLAFLRHKEKVSVARMRWIRGNKVGDDVEKIGKGQVMRGLVGVVFRFFFYRQ